MNDATMDAVQAALLARLAHLESKIKQLKKDIAFHTAGRSGRRVQGTRIDKWSGDHQPVSFRNCNPGNLRPTASGSTRWRGEIDTSNGYACFRDMTHGTRAMLYLLKISYRQRLGLDTIEKIVDRYAPLGDNAAASHAGYIRFLTKQLQHFPDPCDFTDKRVLFVFARAIARFESGKRTTPLSGEAGMKVLEDAYAMLPK